MDVKIDVQLFDEIEAYLQARAAAKDGEAARLLMCLEDAEIQRTAREYQLDGSEAVVYDLFEHAKTNSQIHTDGSANLSKGFKN